MVVHVSPDGTPYLTDVVSLDALKIVVHAAPDSFDRIRGTLAPAIDLADARSAWIDCSLIVRLSARRHDAGWMASWNAAIGWARARGWTTEDGARVRAHVEWRDWAGSETTAQ